MVGIIIAAILVVCLHLAVCCIVILRACCMWVVVDQVWAPCCMWVLVDQVWACFLQMLNFHCGKQLSHMLVHELPWQWNVFLQSIWAQSSTRCVLTTHMEVMMLLRKRMSLATSPSDAGTCIYIYYVYMYVPCKSLEAFVCVVLVMKCVCSHGNMCDSIKCTSCVLFSKPEIK